MACANARVVKPKIAISWSKAVPMRPIALIGVIAALAFPLSARATDGLSALLDTGYVYNLTPGGRERDA